MRFLRRLLGGKRRKRVETPAISGIKLVRLSSSSNVNPEVVSKGLLLEEYMVGPCRVRIFEYEGRGYYIVDEPPLSELEVKAYMEAMEALYFSTKPELLSIELERVIDDVLDAIFKRMWVEGVSYEKVKYYVVRDSVGYGPLDVLIRDPRIEDISAEGVGRPIRVFHRDYSYLDWLVTNIVFKRDEDIDNLVLLLAHKSKKHISTAYPVAEGALPEKHRVTLTFSYEVTPFGSSFTIRKFREEPLTIAHLIKFGTVSPLMAAYWWLLLENKGSIFIVGEMASGKTTLMNALLMMLPPNWKIVCISPSMRVIVEDEVVEIGELYKTLMRTREVSTKDNVDSIPGAERVLAYQVNDRLAQSEVVREVVESWHLIRIPKSVPLVRIKTIRGVIVEVTPNTKIPTLRNGRVVFIEASNVKPGDLIPVLAKLRLSRERRRLKPEVYEALGAQALGDGYVRTRKGAIIRLLKELPPDLYYLAGLITVSGRLDENEAWVEVSSELGERLLPIIAAYVRPVTMRVRGGKALIRFQHDARAFMARALRVSGSTTMLVREADSEGLKAFMAGVIDGLSAELLREGELVVSGLTSDEVEALAEELLRLGVRCTLLRGKGEVVIEGEELARLLWEVKGFLKGREVLKALKAPPSTPSSDVVWEKVELVELIAHEGLVYDAKPKSARYFFAGRGGFIAVEDTIEDTPELRLPHTGWKPLVARPVVAVGEAKTEIGLFDLVKLALRERAQFIVVGEIRGEEAYVFVQSLATGHGGMCLRYETPLLLEVDGRVRVVPVGKLVEGVLSGERMWLSAKLLTPGGWRRLRRVYLRPLATTWVKLRTVNGREELFTPDHVIPVVRDGRLLMIRACEVKQGDKVLTLRQWAYKPTSSYTPGPAEGYAYDMGALLGLYTALKSAKEHGVPAYVLKRLGELELPLDDLLASSSGHIPGLENRGFSHRRLTQLGHEQLDEVLALVESMLRSQDVLAAPKRFVEGLVEGIRTVYGESKGGRIQLPHRDTAFTLHYLLKRCGVDSVVVPGESSGRYELRLLERLDQDLDHGPDIGGLEASTERVLCAEYIVEPAPAYDVEVEGDEGFEHMFVHSSSMITHNCTFHGDSLESMVMRLTTPPINVQPSFLPLISNVVITRYVRLPRRRPMRRVVRVEEITGIKGDKVLYDTMFRWVVEEDKHIPDDPRVVVKRSVKLQRVKSLLGWTDDMLLKDLTERAEFLETLVREGKLSYEDVVKEIRRFYSRRIREMMRFEG